MATITTNKTNFLKNPNKTFKNDIFLISSKHDSFFPFIVTCFATFTTIYLLYRTHGIFSLFCSLVVMTFFSHRIPRTLNHILEQNDN